MDNNPSKWSFSRIISLLVLVSTVLAAAGGLLDFFHLGASGWFFTAAAFLASLSERAQGGASKLAAGIITGDITTVRSADGSQSVNVETR